RVLALTCLIVGQASFASDQRSELKLAALHRQPGHPAWFIIFAAPRKRMSVSVKDAKVSSLDVSAEFPYSVTLTESPTVRYTAVLVFADRAKGVLIDSFGVTVSDELERTDADTHQKFIDRAAEDRAKGISGEHH